MKKKILLFVLLSFLITNIAIAGTVTKGLIGKQDISNWTGTATKTFTRDTSAGYIITLNKLDWVGVDVLQVYGGGVNRNRATLLAALTAVGTSADVALWLSPGNWSLTTSLDASAYTKVKIIFAPGAIIAISDGADLTLFSPENIIAGDRQQIINDSNTGEPPGVLFTEGGRVSLGWWGLVDGGNITSSWQSGLMAINSAGKGTISIPTGDYIFSDYDVGVTQDATAVHDSVGVIIEGNYSVIIYDADTGDRRTFLEIVDSDGVVIRNIAVDGNISNNDKGVTTAGHIIDVQSSGNVEISNVKLSNAQWDGLRISDSGGGDESVNGTVTNFVLDGNQRNNISLVDAKNWTFKSGVIKNAANITAKRISLYSGINIEASTASKFVSDIHFESVEITNNWGRGIGLVNNSGIARNITFENCNVTMDLDGAESIAVNLESEAENFTFDNCRFVGRVAIAGTNTTFRGSTFIQNDTLTGGGGGRNRVLSIGTAATNVRVENNTFNISGSLAKQFVVFDNKNGNAAGSVLLFEGNRFIADGANLVSDNLIDVGNDHIEDLIVWRKNEFVLTGASPGSPYYVTLNENLRTSTIQNNRFDPDIRLDSNDGYATRQQHGVRVTDNSDKSTSGTGEDNLNTVSIKADTMGVTRGIEIFAAGTITNVNNGNKTIKLDWAGQKYTAIAAAGADATDWRIHAIIFNTATGAQRIWWEGIESDGTMLQGYETAAIDTTAAVTVKVTGECGDAADTITQTMWQVNYIDSRN